MKKEGLREKIWQAAEKWDLWGYSGFGLPHIELEGDRRITIEGAGGILEYEPVCIRVAARGCIVRVCGSRMEIAGLEPGVIQLKGRITAVELEAAL